MYIIALPVADKLNVPPAHIGLFDDNVLVVNGTAVTEIVFVVKHKAAPVVSV